MRGTLVFIRFPGRMDQRFTIFFTIRVDELVKSRNPAKFVVPAKAGIQGSR
jgi:hypothetical protein